MPDTSFGSPLSSSSAAWPLWECVRLLVPKSFGQYGHYRGDAPPKSPLARELRRPPGLRRLPFGCPGKKEERQARARQLRGLPRSAGQTCRRPGLGPARQTRHRCALRPLSRGEHRQAERHSPRSLPPTTPPGSPAIPAISRTARPSPPRAVQSAIQTDDRRK
jgi:hypothetical protein